MREDALEGPGDHVKVTQCSVGTRIDGHHALRSQPIPAEREKVACVELPHPGVSQLARVRIERDHIIGLRGSEQEAAAIVDEDGEVRITPIGDVADLMELPYGFHIVKVESRTEESLRPMDEVRDTVRQNLENRKFVETLQEFLARAREESEWRVNEAYLDRAQGL